MCIESYDKQKKMVQYVGFAYQTCRKKEKLNEYDERFLALIEACLSTCSSSTNRIIRHDYLMVCEANWYMDYFAKSSYYRLKKIAIREFINCLEAS